MSKPSAIRAGRAYVEAFLESSKLEKQLGGLRERFKNFSRQVAAVGGVMTGMGTAILGPMAASVKMATEAGNQYAKMASRTGESVENLSALGYAAQRSGVEIDDMVGSIEELNIRLGETIRDGAGPAAEALEQLGLDAQALADMSPVERLQAIADKLSKIQSESQRGFLADEIFGGDAFKMLPLINQGADGIAELMQQARKLGKVLSEEDAKAAAEMDAALTDLRASAEALVVAVGQGLIPETLSWSQYLTESIPAIRQWVSENRELIVTVAKAGAVLVAVGGSLIGLAAVLKAVSIAAGTASTVLKALKGNVLALSYTLGAAFAVAGILLFASAVYDAAAGVEHLNKVLRESQKLNDELLDRRGTSNQFTLNQAREMKGPEKTQFLDSELKLAEKNLQGMESSVNSQREAVEKLTPTWRSLWLLGNSADANAYRTGLEETNEQIKQQEQYVNDLKRARQLEDLQRAEYSGRTREEITGIKGILQQLNEELETFGMDSGQKAIRELEKLNANEEELAAARAKLAELSAKTAQAESEKAAEEERKRAEEEAKETADSIAGIIAGLNEELKTFGMDAGERAIYELQKLNAGEKELAAARQTVADLAQKTTEAEARKAAEEEQKKAEEEAGRTAKTIDDMIQRLTDEVSDLKLPEDDREKAKLLRDLERLGASEEQLKQAAALAEEKARLSGSKTAEMDSPTAQGGTFSSLSSLIFDGRSKEVTAGEKEIIAAIGKGAEKTTTAVKEGFTFSS